MVLSTHVSYICKPAVQQHKKFILFETNELERKKVKKTRKAIQPSGMSRRGALGGRGASAWPSMWSIESIGWGQRP